MCSQSPLPKDQLRIQALGRAALAGLVEAVKELVPGFGPILAAWQAYQAARRLEDLSDQVKEMLQCMCQDYQQLLAPELRAQAKETVTIALREAISVLDAVGLSPQELATEATLDYERAARQVLQQAAGRLQLLDAPTRSLVQRMIEDYYRVFLSHREAIQHVGIPALQALLRRTEELTPRLLAALELHRRQEAWSALLPAVRTFSDALSPENLLEALQAPYRLVAFTGKAHCALREEVVAALRGLEPRQSRAWVLWGLGGAGKTRMAVEVALALGWQAFFVPLLPSRDWASHWSRPDQATLLIVDYAEQRSADELRALAQAVRVAAPERRAPLALLLLMRPNPEEDAARHVADALAEARIWWRVWMVPSVQDTDDRQALFRQARARFRAALCPPDAPPEVDYAPEDLPQTPLALLALAVLAAYGHRVAQSQDDVDILKALWTQWEQARWRRVLEAQGGKALLQTPEVWGEARERVEQALVAASLGRRFTTPEEVAGWWKVHLPFQKTTARGERLDPDWLARRLSVLFPGVEGAWRLPPISPDPLADVVLMRQLRRCPELVSLALPGPEAEPEGAIRAALEHLGVLARLWARGREKEERRRVEGWMQMAAERLAAWPSPAWTALHQALPKPDRTLALRLFLADYYRARLAQAPSEEERALALGMQSVALSALGRREEALAAAQEAVDIRRQLAVQQPDAFLPDLARSLAVYGVILRGLGRHAEAAAAFAEGLRVIHPFVRASPAAFGELANALLQNYRGACEAVEETPDEALVAQARQAIG